MCVYTCRPEESTRSHLDSCESPCDCWELNSGLLEEQQVLLTSEPSLQPHATRSFYKKKSPIKVVAVHSFNSSTPEAQVGESLWVRGQPGLQKCFSGQSRLQTYTLFQKKKEGEEEEEGLVLLWKPWFRFVREVHCKFHVLLMTQRGKFG